MMRALAQLVVWLNGAANAVGTWLLAPIGALPGWLSATLVSVATGVLLLLVYKYTSPQRAVKRVRDDISANLLALWLFSDSASVAVLSQGRLLRGAARLLLLALVPMLVMLVPVSLLLGQMSIWYHARPLAVDDEAVLTMKLRGGTDAAWPDVQLQPTPAVEDTTGPIRVQSEREICWNIKARQNGYHRLLFQVNGQTIDKELAVGDGYMRVSATRPGWSWFDVLENPGEPPFGPDASVQSIQIDYPERSSWKIAGLELWMVYWFIVSMIAGFCGSRIFNVNI
jgi:hypothetical protein